MKRFFVIVILLIGTLFFTGCTSLPNKNEEVKYNYESVKDEIIRFHVIANSDNKKDQDLKLKVRNEVIKFIEPLLNKSKSIEESRRIIKINNKKIIKIAKKVIKENGYNYKVEGKLSKENFPEKMYGNIVLPQGEYEAYRILIGNASGQNWWCVMFPPLCFVDVTKGEVAYNETEKRMNEVLDSEELGNNKEKKEISNNKDKEDYNIKFKFLEVLKEAF
ncbi:stage II sporulation protein R [Clostridium moniliforme]|uniref:Stage II sporulation protein R n=1 Tax=Clostridium moniliforme TaxID=39489 RepID=A0ABS4F352_9CLOT|nr:stage II sporulation protein R [Clostridium moniliforme]MBP1890654.1 stage II sporulation protein R [Clostridium moniliforme]